MTYVAYYRVSTRKQGRSGLGLEAQREAVLRFIRRNGNSVVAEYTEQESGKNDQRPELLKAINTANEHDATLVIARLDRLSRNVSFISHLMDSKVRFVCCDMPEATELTIHIFAAMAQHERQLISRRICEALQAKRNREPEWQPGNPENLTDEARKKAHQTISRKAQEDIAVRHAFHFIHPRRVSGMSYQRIADELNDEDYRTRTGKLFHPAQVRNIWRRFV